jgi:cobalt-precorrin 5A hydrolase
MAGEKAMIVAGIGCRRGTLTEDIVNLVHEVLARLEVPREKLDAIATEAAKANDHAIEDAARYLSVRLIACGIADLEEVADQVITRSSRVQALKGVPSIAEAAALVAAGRNARLLGPRVATDKITCAIAIGEGS